MRDIYWPQHINDSGQRIIQSLFQTTIDVKDVATRDKKITYSAKRAQLSPF